MSVKDSTNNPLMSSEPVISSKYLQNIEQFVNETLEAKYVGLNYAEIIKTQNRNSMNYLQHLKIYEKKSK